MSTPAPGSSRASTSWTSRCATRRSSWSTSRPPAARRAADGDHRDRRGAGVRRRGARRVPDAGQPRHAHHAVRQRAHRHHRRDGVPRRRRSRAVLPAFLEFARGSVLVAHNAPFDVGFLQARLRRARTRRGPASRSSTPRVLARRVLTRDEVPNCKLATLAAFFRAATTPTHRALQDARATVDVLHGLIGRLGNLGVQSLPELRAFTAQVSDAQRRKRHLADGLPAAPGRLHLPRRAAARRSTSAPAATCARGCGSTSSRARRAAGWARWSGLAERVDPIACAHALEAQVRELRLIAAHKPRYNRRSKFPERAVWLKLTDEAFPRLSIVRDVRARRRGLPRAAALAAAGRGGPRRDPRRRAAAPVHRPALAAPGGAGRVRARRHRPLLRRRARAASPASEYARAGRTGGLGLGRRRRGRWSSRCERKLAALSAQQRYEQAAVVRDRIATVVRACARMQRLTALQPHRRTRRGAARTATAAGSCAVRPAAAGSRPPGRRPAGCRAVAGDRGAAWPPPTPSTPRHRAAGGARRGDRVHPALARGTGHPAGPTPASRGRCRRSAPAACVPTSAPTRRGAVDPFADRRRLPVLARPPALRARVGPTMTA